MTSYFSATRHPWSSFLFLLPLLAAYEGGVLWLGGDRAEQIRNGADAWLRWALESLGEIGVAEVARDVEMLLVIEMLVRKHQHEMVEPGLSLFSATRHLERIADHATNIAEDVIYLVEGQSVRHKPSELKD